MKVNLQDIQSRLVKRGRDAYENESLSAELRALNPDDKTDAFVFPEAQGNPADENYTNHKNLWRNRVKSVADSIGIPEGALSIQWTTNGEMVVSYKA